MKNNQFGCEKRMKLEYYLQSPQIKEKIKFSTFLQSFNVLLVLSGTLPDSLFMYMLNKVCIQNVFFFRNYPLTISVSV